MIPSKRSVPSSANPKKLIRPQRTRQSKNAVELASADVYDFVLDSDAPTAIDRDDSFRSYIACEAEETLNAAGSEGIAKDTKTQSMRLCVGPGSGGKTLCILDHSDSALSTNPSKVIVPPELELEIFTLNYLQGLLQRAFLSKDKTPKKEDMEGISGQLYQLEDGADLHSNAIRATKIRRTLTEILKLEIIPGGSEFQFRSRFKRLLERCNKALEREKLLADNMEQPAELPKTSADDTRTVSNASSVLLKVADNSKPYKRKRQNIDHVTRKNKRLRNTHTVIIVDSEDEDESSQDSSQDQSHQDESRQSDTSQYGTLQDGAPLPRRAQRKSIIDKEEFRKQVDCDFKWIDNTKGLVKDAKELVEELLPMLDKQEEQILEQRVKVKGLAQQLNDIVDFLNSCGA